MKSGIGYTTGLWGDQFSPGPNDTAFVMDTLAGFEITPAAQPDPGDTQDIERTDLQYATEPLTNAYAWESFVPFVEDSTTEDEPETTITETIMDDSQKKEDERETKIMNTILAAKQTRDQLLQNLGADGFTLDLDHLSTKTKIEDAFLFAPIVGDLDL